MLMFLSMMLALLRTSTTAHGVPRNGIAASLQEHDARHPSHRAQYWGRLSVQVSRPARQLGRWRRVCQLGQGTLPAQQLNGWRLVGPRLAARWGCGAAGGPAMARAAHAPIRESKNSQDAQRNRDAFDMQESEPSYREMLDE